MRHANPIHRHHDLLSEFHLVAIGLLVILMVMFVFLPTAR